MNIDQALKIVRAAGYRVSRPKLKKQFRVGPTCVVKFADGVVTRMTTHCDDDKLDYDRGFNLCLAAWQSRTRSGNMVPGVHAVHFERDGKVISRLA
jgi:hypothetical protein